MRTHLSLPRRDLIRLKELLGLLQVHLESEIDSERLNVRLRQLAKARRNWKDAERFVKLLEACALQRPS